MSIDISGIEKAKLLAGLFNASKQQGMGFLDPDGATPITEEKAAEIIKQVGTNFDYLMGRVLKVDIGGDSLEEWLYDRDNGEGAAAAVIEKLRAEM